MAEWKMITDIDAIPRPFIALDARTGVQDVMNPGDRWKNATHYLDGAPEPPKAEPCIPCHGSLENDKGEWVECTACASLSYVIVTHRQAERQIKNESLPPDDGKLL
jgi:hypothetical protein